MSALVDALYPGDRAALLAVTALVQITAVILLAWGIAGRFLRHWPAARHAVWLSCLAFTAACPLVVWVADRAGLLLFTVAAAAEHAVSPVQVGSADMPSEPPTPALGAPAMGPFHHLPPREMAGPVEILQERPSAASEAGAWPPVEPVVAVESPAAATAGARGLRSVATAAALVWALGLVYFVARLLHGLFYLLAIRRTTSELEEAAFPGVLARVRRSLGVAALPPIFLSEKITTPAVVGLFRPAVLLPASLVQTISATRLQDVLVHECAHILRGDPWTGILQRLVAIVYWPHPLVHWMNRQLARCREELCDNYVLSGAAPVDYADTLLQLAIDCRSRLVVPSSVGLFSLEWRLEDRIRGLLDRCRDRSVRLAGGSRLRVLGSACVVFLAVATLGLTAPRAEPKAQSAPSQADARSERPSPARAGAEEGKTSIEGIVVDEKGQPLEGIEVRSLLAIAEASAVTGPDGRFQMALSGGLPVRPPLLARSKDGSRIGTSIPEPVAMAAGAKQAKSEPLRIVLKPARSVEVIVKTAAGEPVVGALVEALGEATSFGGTTDPQGRVTLRVDPAAAIRWIVAFKDRAGFDYYENYHNWPSIKPDPPPEAVSLSLHPSRPTTVRTVDSADRPVAGVFVSPWVLRLPGKLSYVNFSASTAAGRRSDSHGVCHLGWLPEDASGQIGFQQYADGYHCPNLPTWDPRRSSEPVVFRLLKNAQISGMVRFPDGKPAAGIAVLAEGRGATNIYFRGSTRTGADGTYRLSIYPRQSTIVGIFDHQWAAPSHTGVELEEGKAREHLDFTLLPGTRIHGRVTVGPDQKPDSQSVVTLIELGEHLAGEARQHGHQRANLVRWTMVNEHGNYEFRVGRGQFTLRLPNTNPNRADVEIRVNDQPELVYNSAAAQPAQMRITGTVVSAAEGKPVGGATVYGEPVGPSGYARFETRTDDNGRFALDRLSDTEEYGFYARAPEKDLAGFSIVPSSRKEVTVALRPAATVVGRVYDADSKPVEGQKVTAILGCSPEGCTSINVHAVTDKEGRYRIPGLAVGSRCSISVQHEGTFLAGINVNLDRSGEIEARDTVLPRSGAGTARPAPKGTVRPIKTRPGSDEPKTPPVDQTFTGTIRNGRTRQPIPGATVVVRRMILNPAPGADRQVLEETRHTTDEQGHYTFTVRKEHASPALNEANRRTYIEIDVRSPGYVERTGLGYSLSMILKNLAMGERPFFENFTLVPGKEITGVVASPDATPLADVLIQAYFHDPSPGQFGGFHEYQTDQAGRFRMTIPTPGGAVLWILPEAYAPMEVVVDDEPAGGSDGRAGKEVGQGPTIVKRQRGDLGMFTVEKGLTLVGVLFTEDGKPVASQWVHARQVRDSKQHHPMLASVAATIDRFAKTDAQGKVAFGPLPPGKYAVEPSQRDRWRLRGKNGPATAIPGVFYPLTATLDADSAGKPFTLKAVPAVKIVAQYYGSDGKKTSGHEVFCFGRTQGSAEYWQTAGQGQNGRIELLAPRGLEDARLMLVTNEHSSLRFRKSANDPLQAGRELKLGTLTGDLTDIRILRYVAPILLVKPTDAAGKPLDAAEATARYDNASIREAVRFEKQKDGRYRSQQLLPDEPFTLTVTAPSHVPQSRALSLAEGTTAELVVKLQR